MAEPPVPPYSAGRDQAEPAMLGERLEGLSRRMAFVVAFLGVFRRADVVEQLLDVAAQRLLVGREGEIHRRSPCIESR
jgi:hypothetical protein